MIVTVCLNPAVDVTYRIAELRSGASHRVLSGQSRAGGKATNVARVLGQLGVPARLVAPLGGSTGTEFTLDAEANGLDLVPIPIRATTRRTVTVVDTVDATVFNEPGPEISAREWVSVLAAVRATVGPGDVLVLAGSVPPGAPADAYAQLTGLGRAARATVLLDAEGPQLREALAAGPDLVKPNVHEASSLLGRPLVTTSDVRAAADSLIGAGALAAVVSRGAAGLVAVTADGAWAAHSPLRLTGNPTGAGDSLTAALATGLAQGVPWPELLRTAVATSAAAVPVAVAGAIDLPTRARVLPEVVVEKL